MVTKGLLLHLGCDVLAVVSGDDCVNAVTNKHRVVFLDVSVPIADHFEIAVRIREKFSKQSNRPLVVALTGNTDKIVKENCLRVGMDGVVVKPVPVDKMRSILSELLKHGFLAESQ